MEPLTLVFSDAGFACVSGVLDRINIGRCPASAPHHTHPTHARKKAPTRVRFDLVYPLRLLFLVLPIAAPPIHPRLVFLIPDCFRPVFFLDAFGGGEAFPFSGRFGFRKGFGAREGGCGWGELGEGAVGGGNGWEGVEGGEEGLDAVPGS